MKKKFIFCLVGMIILFSGCSNKNDVVNSLKNKIEKLKSYQMNGELEIVNNENIYKYDINVLYKKDDNFKVQLKNKSNEHKQIILKNEKGVYVKTQESTKQKLNVI